MNVPAILKWRGLRLAIGVGSLTYVVLVIPTLESSATRSRRESEERAVAESIKRDDLHALRVLQARTMKHPRQDGQINWSQETIASFRARGGLNSNAPDAVIQAIITRNADEQLKRDAINAMLRPSYRRP